MKGSVGIKYKLSFTVLSCCICNPCRRRPKLYYRMGCRTAEGNRLYTGLSTADWC